MRQNYFDQELIWFCAGRLLYRCGEWALWGEHVEIYNKGMKKCGVVICL